jgi:hypothetical protein
MICLSNELRDKRNFTRDMVLKNIAGITDPEQVIQKLTLLLENI